MMLNKDEINRRLVDGEIPHEHHELLMRGIGVIGEGGEDVKEHYKRVRLMASSMHCESSVLISVLPVSHEAEDSE